MTTLMRIKLSELNPELIQEWKQKFGDAELEIMVGKPGESAFGEADFWNTISLFDWTKEGDDYAVIEPAVADLANRSLADIRQFEEILAEKLWLLDTPAHAKASLHGDDSNYLSVDGFLYDRCCVVANGQELYDQVLKDAKEFPAGYSFETLLSLSSLAFERKTGTEYFPYFTRVSYETYSNKEAWGKKNEL